MLKNSALPGKELCCWVRTGCCSSIWEQSAHLGDVALCCLPRSALLARALFRHGTGRWHKTSPHFLDKDRWGLSTISPVNSFPAATTGNTFLSLPQMSNSGNHSKWGFAEISVWTRKVLWEIVPLFQQFTFLLHPHFLNTFFFKKKKKFTQGCHSTLKHISRKHKNYRHKCTGIHAHSHKHTHTRSTGNRALGLTNIPCRALFTTPSF